MARPRLLRAACAAGALLLSLSACGLTGQITKGGGGGETPSASASPTTKPGWPKIGTSSAAGLKSDPASDKAYASFYDQKADWKPCDDYQGAQCATIKVPSKWNDASSSPVSVALVKVPATGQKKGSLLMNPGGPGGSGVDFVGSYGAQVVGKDVHAAYDLIGFDPRGVGDSDGIECLDDKQTDELLSEDTPEDQGLGPLTETMKKVADACEQHSAPMLPVMDTLSAARDMDVIRAAVDSEKLDYLGFSYGTYLGQTYAETYPERVGRFVLDGVLDPAIDGDQLTSGQAKGFERAIGAFADWCGEQDKCALDGDRAQKVKEVRTLLDSLADKPLDTGDPDRPLTQSLGTTAVIMAMYSDEMWRYLNMGLENAKQGDGRLLLAMADQANDREPDGKYKGNGTYSIIGVNCLDHPSVEDDKGMEKLAKELEKESPTFGEDMSYGGLTCKEWPVDPVRTPAPIHAKGAPPMMLIGTTGDPATPYAWAQDVHKAIANSRLVTFEGNGHTAYGRSGGCVEKAVDTFLVDGTMPQKDLTCK